jgi:ParB/RepB/Spo0J family partition protein
VSALPMGHHQYIPLAKLTASPLNHRKHFDEAKMAELTENIRVQGVIVPIIARPMLVRPDGKLGAEGLFEVVAGERRYRAAKAAKLADIPAIVRELTDAQALELQVIENNQRVDVHPLEEAEGYEALMKCTRSDGSRYTAEEIGAKVGKSRTYVFGRLKLCALCPEARKAFYAGDVDASKALLIARIGHHDTQRQALKDIQGNKYDGPMSYREAHEHILQTYMLQLKSAPFDLKDELLLPKAGACGPCPKRTGNQADLFGDVKSADVCTDPTCFADKRMAHHEKAVADLEAKGMKVIHGEAAKNVFPQWDHNDGHWRDELSDRYLPASGHTWIGSRQVAVRDALGADFEPTLVQHPATGKVVEVVTRKALEAAAKTTKTGSKAKITAAKPAKPKGPDVDEMLTTRLAELIYKKAPKQFGKIWLLDLAKQLVAHLSTRDLDAVALAWGWKSSAFRSGSYSSRKLPPEAAKLGERDLVLLMFHICFAIGQVARGDVLKLFGIKEPEIREQVLEERKAAARKAREEAKAKAAAPAKKAAKK